MIFIPHAGFLVLDIVEDAAQDAGIDISKIS
jgi:hypothetical protein